MTARRQEQTIFGGPCIFNLFPSRPDDFDDADALVSDTDLGSTSMEEFPEDDPGMRPLPEKRPRQTRQDPYDIDLGMSIHRHLVFVCIVRPFHFAEPKRRRASTPKDALKTPPSLLESPTLAPSHLLEQTSDVNGE